MKKIHRKSEDILKEWLLTLLPEEESISSKDIKKYLPEQGYFIKNKSVRLSNFSYKWTTKIIKKMYKSGVDINTLTYDKFNNTYKRYII